jgi:hypothetical protein
MTYSFCQAAVSVPENVETFDLDRRLATTAHCYRHTRGERCVGNSDHVHLNLHR